MLWLQDIPHESENMMPADTASNAGASAAPPPGRYQLDPERTRVRADVKAMFGLLTVHGSLRLRSGEVLIAADPARSSVTAVIDSGSFASGNAKRDRDVTSAGLLDAGTYPEITFEAGSVRPDGAQWVVTGRVTAHGKSVDAELRVDRASLQEGVAVFHATTRLERAEFGITKKKGMVGQTAHITIDAIAEPT